MMSGLCSCRASHSFEFVHLVDALLTDHPCQDLPACALDQLATDAPLPFIGKDRGHQVAQMQRLEQFPLAAVEPRFIAERADVQSIGHRSGELVFHHEPAALRTHQARRGVAGLYRDGDVIVSRFHSYALK